ncbi:hypothetical protein [Actinokineospora sp. NBRC 105648]|uniref:hypothetical protein n=1 Tax=Actinokineospora sp. NBRC 105648 TaxID=3032206 RepID=UPI002556F941|nr:hypothetical protein [Actinokineospora sp. NBRC 105648]
MTKPVPYPLTATLLAPPLFAVLANLLDRTQWTQLARLRAIQLAAVGAWLLTITACVAALVTVPLALQWILYALGATTFAFAVIVAVYGAVHFPDRRFRRPG